MEKQQKNIDKLFQKTEINIKNKLLDTMIRIPGIIDIVKALPDQLELVESVQKTGRFTASKLQEYSVTLDNTVNKVKILEDNHNETKSEIHQINLKLSEFSERIEQLE